MVTMRRTFSPRREPRFQGSTTMGFSFLLFFTTLCYILLWTVPCTARQILAVDLGMDFAKAATLGVSEGVMRTNIVLNDQTNRKSPHCVALRFVPYNGTEHLRHIERIFAEPARALEPRFPSNVMCGASVLAGLPPPADSAAFPFAIVPHAPRGSAAVQIGGSDGSRTFPVMEFSAEEIVGMFLGHMRRAAERGLGGEPLRHAVVTIPPHASVAQRQALVDAAALTGLRAVRLVHPATAAAVQLAQQNAEPFFGAGAAERYVMVYDMGGDGAEAAVFRLSPAAQRGERGRISRVSTATDRSLGGRGFDRCLARYVERELFPAARPPVDPLLSGGTGPSASAAQRRAVVALLRAAREARERLSANHNAPFVAQGVRPGGGDFAATVTREAFERACAEQFAAAVSLRDAAVAAAAPGLAGLKGLARLEVIGGATRTPRLLERLGEGFGRAPDRTLNSDEAAALGAAMLGAESAGIARTRLRVVEPATNDVYFTVAPSLATQDTTKEGAEEGTERRLLFEQGKTQLPAVQSLRFANRTADFTLTLESGEGTFVRPNTISGVADAIAATQDALKTMNTQTRLKKSTGTQRITEVFTLEQSDVIVEVSMSESGIPRVSNAYVLATYRAESFPLPNTDTAENRTNNETAEDIPLSEATSETPRNNTVLKTDTGNAHPLKTKDNAQDEDGNGTPLMVVDAEKREKEGEEEREEEFTKTEEETKNKDVEEEDERMKEAPEEKEKIKESNTTRVFTRGFALRFSSPRGRLGINLTPDEAIVARDRLRALQLIDDERLLRSALRNDVEALVLHLKSLPTWASGPDGSNNDWRAVVAEVEQWMDDASDDVETAVLQRQLDRLRELKTE